MKTIKIGLTCFFVFILIAAGCEVTPSGPEEKTILKSEVDEAIAVMKAKDPGIQKFFNKSYGYAVLPKIFKAAVLAGGAYGKGEVYEQGVMIGFCDMKQITGGASLGGEFYREIVFFRDKKDLERFKEDEYTFSAQVTGIAIVWGVAAKADYKDGVAVFVLPDTGLMVDVSLGGQKFNFAPKYVLEKVKAGDVND